MKPGHWAAIAVAAAVVAWVWMQQSSMLGGFNQPPKQASPDDDVARLTHSGAPHCHPEQHHAGYVYTPHRYPRATGGEITTVIHKGFSTMRVPGGTPDVQWIIAPPSEVMV